MTHHPVISSANRAGLLVLLALVILAWCIAAPAQETQQDDKVTVGFNIATAHYRTGTPHPYNYFNPGVYLERWSVVVGAYYNSEHRTSVQAGYLFRSVAGSPLDLLVGVVTGYTTANVAPMLVPSIRLPLGDDGLAMRISLILPIGKGSPGLHLSTEF